VVVVLDATDDEDHDLPIRRKGDGSWESSTGK